MSFRSAARRWGVPASAVALLLIPLMVAGCPWEGYPDELSWMLAECGFPDECQDCYAEFMGFEEDDYGGATIYDIQTDVSPGGAETGSIVPGGEGPADDPGDDPRDTTTGRRTGPPEEMLRPRVDPNLRHVPNYREKSTTKPSTTPKPTTK